MLIHVPTCLKRPPSLTVPLKSQLPVASRFLRARRETRSARIIEAESFGINYSQLISREYHRLFDLVVFLINLG